MATYTWNTLWGVEEVYSGPGNGLGTLRGRYSRFLDGDPERGWMDTRCAHPFGPVDSLLYGEGHSCRRVELGASKAGGSTGSEGPILGPGQHRAGTAIYGFSLFLPLLAQRAWDPHGLS